MALRLASKINRHFIHKNHIKRLSEKSVISSTKSVCTVKAPAEPQALTVPPSSVTKICRYQVCRPKTSPIFREKSSLIQEGVDPVKNADSPLMQTDSAPSCSYKLDISGTVRNVTLPFKMPRLSNPFPDPVKVMASHTMSDQDKADQMLADSKAVRNSAVESSSTMKLQRRNFSSDSGSSLDPSKCKKMKKVSKKACTKMVAPGCIPPKSISCLTRAHKHAECVKKEAPYPSYSETCHEDLEEKPSECKLCPWKPEDNPNFKPPKNKYHTSAVARCLTKGDCEKPAGAYKEPCGWVKKDKCKKDDAKGKKEKGKETPTKKKAIAFLDSPLGINEYLCDMKKLPCKKPPPTPCESPKKKEKKIVKKKKKEEECPDMIDNKIRRQKEREKAESEKTKKKGAMSLTEDINKWLLSTQLKFVEPAISEEPVSEFFSSKGKPPSTSGKCKKLPFDKCPPPKKRKPRNQVMGGCPPKLKKKKVKDCPPDDEEKEKCQKTMGYGMPPPMMSVSRSLHEMSLQGVDDDKTKKKCPKVNLGVCKDEAVDDEDPCGRRRRGRTDICKPNLLDRYKKKKDKPKPKKTASTYIPLPPVLKSNTSTKTM